MMSDETRRELEQRQTEAHAVAERVYTQLRVLEGRYDAALSNLNQIELALHLLDQAERDKTRRAQVEKS